MTFEIESGGRFYRISVEAIGASGPSGGHFSISLREDSGIAAVPGAVPEVDGIETRRVEVRQTSLGLSLVDSESRRSLDVAVTERAGGEFLVQLPRVDIPVVVDARRYQRAGPRDVANTGEQRVTAPMPGRVLRFLVQVGDEVAAGQGLVVIEAMKMENELTALRPGRVTALLIVEGGSVESGRLLLVIE